MRPRTADQDLTQKENKHCKTQTLEKSHPYPVGHRQETDKITLHNCYTPIYSRQPTQRTLQESYGHETLQPHPQQELSKPKGKCLPNQIGHHGQKPQKKL